MEIKMATPLDLIRAARALYAAGNIEDARDMIAFALNAIAYDRAAGKSGGGVDSAEKLARRLASEWA